MTTSIQKGVKIPVLEVEKLWLTKDGRGLNAFDDADVLCRQTFAKPSVWASGGHIPLCAADTVARLKITYVSGTTETVGYIPIFSGSVLI
jgi:hypothetical protein